jgi:pre-mRNA-splicing factor CWC22
VELAIGFLKESGQKLLQICPRGLDSIFSTLRNLLYESLLQKRTKDMIEVIFAVRKDRFKDNPAIQSGLDLVDENDQYTHMLTLDDPCQPESMLGNRNFKFKSFILLFSSSDVFKYDDQYEEKYKKIRRTLLDESSGDDDDDSSSNSSDTDEEGGGAKKDDVDEEEQEMNQAESK